MPDIRALIIEGSGLLFVALLMVGLFAIYAERQRLIFGIILGLLFAGLILPFLAYLVARFTNHNANTVDSTPPLYIITVAVATTFAGILGAVWGWKADQRFRRKSPRSSMQNQTANFRSDDETYVDRTEDWLPWKTDRN